MTYTTVESFRTAVEALGKGNDAWARAWVSCIDKDRNVMMHDSALDALVELAGSGRNFDAFIGVDDDYNLVGSVNLSDTFYYAAADAEPFGVFDVFWLRHLNRVLPRGGVVWAARKRGLDPIPPILNSDEYQAALLRYDAEWANFVAALEAAPDSMQILRLPHRLSA